MLLITLLHAKEVVKEVAEKAAKDVDKEIAKKVAAEFFLLKTCTVYMSHNQTG